MTDQHGPAPAAPPVDDSPLLRKLRAQKEAAGTEVESLTLPASGVRVTFPRHRTYQAWEKAQRLVGDGGPGRLQLLYLLQVCTFDGERLKANDYAELIQAEDHLALMGRIFGAGAPGDSSGDGPSGNG
jgi:hypothetical protein